MAAHEGTAASQHILDLELTQCVPKRDDQGLYECEAWTESPEINEKGDLTGAEGSKEWKTCTKNPGHKHFISAPDFGLEHLPEVYRTPDVLGLIKAEADLTVRLRVGHTSAERPDGYPFSKYKGQDASHTGTGVITSVVVESGTDSDSDDSDEDGLYPASEEDEREEEIRRRDFEAHQQQTRRPAFTKDDCPCHDCEDVRYLARLENGKYAEGAGTGETCERAQPGKSDGNHDHKGGDISEYPQAKSQGDDSSSNKSNDEENSISQERPCWLVHVETALHVVYDTKEARKTVVDVFYDTNTPSPRSQCLYGFRIVNRFEEEDRCILECATHNGDLVNTLYATKAKRYKLNKSLGTPLVKQVNQSSSSPTDSSSGTGSGPEKIDQESSDLLPQAYRMAVVIGHPHGRSKTITVGHWVHRKKTPGTKFACLTHYLYDTPTCKGNSGGAVMTFGRIEDERATTVLLNHHHKSGGTTAGLNVSSPSWEYSREMFGIT